MNLEERVDKRKNFLETSIDLFNSGLATTGAYNLAGYIATHTDFSDNTTAWTTAGLLTAGAIIGYKARRIIKNKIKKIKRNIIRNKTLAEISKDEEFMQRQKIQKGDFGITRKALRGLLLSPIGAALGYFPGQTAIIPLCAYFGNNYKWHPIAALDSGPIAGAAVGAYAFAEMAAKKQYERLFTTASSLVGISGAYILTFDALDKIGIWPWLGICAGTGIAGGIAGNFAYKGCKKTKEKIYDSIKQIAKEELKKELEK
jgi:hypothetical protein